MKTNHNIVLGFDFGTKYIGIAAGQKISRTASPITSLLVKNNSPNWEYITDIIEKWNPAVLVVGLPLNMDGTTQPITIIAQNFVKSLESIYKLPVYLVDERLSTWEAKTRLKLKKTILNKQELTKINAQAAVILTEQWLGDADIPLDIINKLC
jgi:putative Holliday junction resolvase